MRRLQPQVRVGLERYGLVELIGADRLYTTNRGAAEAFERAGVTAPARAD